MLSAVVEETLTHAFTVYHQDWIIIIHCSGVYLTQPRSLQLVKNAVARLLTRTRKMNHITPIFTYLKRLPITATADFKVLLLTYQASRGSAPPDLKDLIITYSPTRTLRSSGVGLLSLTKVKNNPPGLSVRLSSPPTPMEQSAPCNQPPYSYGTVCPL